MRIAIDVSALAGAQGGMRIYLEELLKELARIDQKNEYWLYLARWRDLADAERQFPTLENLRFKRCLRRFPFRLLMNLENRLGLRVQERWLLPEVDLFHGACQTVPPLTRTRSVITVHHFEEMRYTHISDWDNFYYWQVYKNSVERADSVIADSQYTRRYLQETFKLPEEKISVIYHGIFNPKPVFTAEEKRAHRTAYGLPERFVVCVSHMHLRKNTVRLVQAFARLPESLKDVHLVLVGGGHPWYIEEVRKAVAEAGISERVHFTGPVAHDQAALFYATAELFVLPSLLEGFGIPLIEAMAMGVAVCASTTTSIPEVVGGAGLHFDPENLEEMSEQMRRILEDDALRRELIAKGLARSSEFTWENAARSTLEVYHKTCP